MYLFLYFAAVQADFQLQDWLAEDEISSSVHNISSSLGCLQIELQADTKDYVLYSLLHIRQECWDQPPAATQMEQGGFVDTVTAE